MRHVFIVNPMAGKRDSVRNLLEQIRAVFPRDGYEVYPTTAAGDARRLAREAAEPRDAVRIYACGGDGTLNEVVNGAAGFDNAAITNVPLGTGNDFLKIFGKEARTRFADVAALKDGPWALMDLIDCNGLLGLNTVCAGVDARVAAGVGRYKRLPLVKGMGAYGLSLVENLFRGVKKPMVVDMGPIHHAGPTTILCVCNGRYYGGGFYPVPEAMPDDGVLDMLLIGDITTPQLAKYIGKYSSGKYQECPPGLIRAWHGDAVTISSTENITVAVDGEIMEDKGFTIRLSEKKIRFFWPAGLSYALSDTL